MQLYFASFVYWLQAWMFLSKSWVHAVNSPMLFSSYNCIVVPWLVLGEKSSSGVLNLEPLPREHRPRPTKCKDSENDSVTLQPRKNVHILGAENVHEISTILCTGKLETLKFTDQQTCVCSVHTNWKSFLEHQVSMKAKWRILHLCWDNKNLVLDSYYQSHTRAYGFDDSSELFMF